MQIVDGLFIPVGLVILVMRTTNELFIPFRLPVLVIQTLNCYLFHRDCPTK